MEFKRFNQEINAHIASMLRGATTLFFTGADKDALYNLYLDSFPEGTNKMFRTKREYDCSCCKQFIRNFGNVVTVQDNKLVSIWDGPISDPTYQIVAKAMSTYVKSFPIKDVFLTKEARIGTEQSRELKEGVVTTWNHFATILPKQFVTNSSESVEALMAIPRDIRNVFVRSITEIAPAAVATVRELIAQKSLYKGEEWESVLAKFAAIQYEAESIADRDAWYWVKSIEVGPVIGKIKNHSIGTLLVNISEGMELDEAVTKYEAIVAPTNYKRPKAIFTKKMVEAAEATIQSLGLSESLGRRFATLDDISINNVLFANRDAAPRMKGGSVFDSLKSESNTINPKSFDKVETIGIEAFIRDVLPQISTMELLVENQHAPNFVSLIAPLNKEAPSLFKWGNPFSYAYDGNITDSLMKERVKAAGGNVSGVLRFSIQWNEAKDNNDDLDAHCIEPGGIVKNPFFPGRGSHIFYGARGPHPSTGELDVDIQVPGDQVAVENITYSDAFRMPEGDYTFLVRNYRSRGAKSGFTAEIEFGGTIHSFSYAKPLRQDQDVEVAVISYSRKDGFTVKKSMGGTVSARTVWGVSTQQFVPVTVMCFSPNYWDGSHVGNRHYFFFLKGCVNDSTPNGFFNEFLREEFMPHKRVFEALGSKLRVEPSADQLSGLGFSSTKKNSVVVKVTGAFTRMLRLEF